MTKQLPNRWLISQHVRCVPPQEAWWYGEKHGLTVCIQERPGVNALIVKIPKRKLLSWARDTEDSAR